MNQIRVKCNEFSAKTAQMQVWRAQAALKIQTGK